MEKVIKVVCGRLVLELQARVLIVVASEDLKAEIFGDVLFTDEV